MKLFSVCDMSFNYLPVPVWEPPGRWKGRFPSEERRETPYMTHFEPRNKKMFFGGKSDCGDAIEKFNKRRCCWRKNISDNSTPLTFVSFDFNTSSTFVQP